MQHGSKHHSKLALVSMLSVAMYHKQLTLQMVCHWQQPAATSAVFAAAAGAAVPLQPLPLLS
jgi:hypothetical protein